MTKTTPPVRAYNVALASIKQQQQELHSLSTWLAKHQKAANALAKRFEKLPGDMNTSKHSPYAYASLRHNHFTLGVSCYNVTGFKCEELAKVLELFVDADRMTTKDYAESMNREFTFEWDVEGGVLRVRVDVYVQSNSPTCVRVLKETKVVTREDHVYEMVCVDEIEFVGAVTDDEGV